MNRKSLALATVLSLAGFAVQAETPDLSGQFAQGTPTTTTRAQVQADLNQSRQAGVSPWSISYNPLNGFRSERSRAEVQAEFIASRNAVAAMTSEDSGSAFLAARQPSTAAAQFAGQPVNAQ
jgi:hypothetical protein